MSLFLLLLLAFLFGQFNFKAMDFSHGHSIVIEFFGSYEHWLREDFTDFIEFA